MGVIQHHDAISGTEWQHVADDYVQRLSQGIDAALVSNQNTRMNSFHLRAISHKPRPNVFKRFFLKLILALQIESAFFTEFFKTNRSSLAQTVAEIFNFYCNLL
jgi:hypothetical protein